MVIGLLRLSPLGLSKLQFFLENYPFHLGFQIIFHSVKKNLLHFYFRFLCFDDFPYPPTATTSYIVYLCFLPFLFLISLAGSLYILLIASALRIFFFFFPFSNSLISVLVFINSIFLDSFYLHYSFLVF